MSRLDSFIRRLQAQRACLESAAHMIDAIPGPVCELGLGNGRTFDHLRALLPQREIFVLDRQVAAHPGCVPDSDHLILGDFRVTLPDLAGRIGAPAALIHVDCGTGDELESRSLGQLIAEHLMPVMCDGGVIASDQPMRGQVLRPLNLPPKVPEGRYFLYQVHPHVR